MRSKYVPTLELREEKITSEISNHMIQHIQDFVCNFMLFCQKVSRKTYKLKWLQLDSASRKRVAANIVSFTGELNFHLELHEFSQVNFQE
jgi:hypothetical protein